MMAMQTAPHYPGAKVKPSLDPNSLAKFVDPLPIPRIVRSAERRVDPMNAGNKIPFYRLEMSQFEARVHRDMKPTRLWGIGGSSPGPTIETRSGEGVLVEWANHLPTTHFLPIDHSLHGAEKDKPDVRAVIHLHGGKRPRKVMAIQKIGICRGNRRHITI